MGKKKEMVPRAAKQPASHPAVVNPFERKPSSKKHQVLGRVKGAKSEAKSVTKARSEAYEQRKKTLGIEARNDGKENRFLDRRFGESEDMPEEDKFLMRFQRERMAKAKKGSAFALEDEDELTHKGMSLGQMDDFDVDRSSDEEDDEGAKRLNRETVRDYHFGGGFVKADEEDEERKKTKKEVMEEIIAKSKLYKAERRKEKHEKDELLDQLDADFGGLSDLFESMSRPKREKDGRKRKAADEPGDGKAGKPGTGSLDLEGAKSEAGEEGEDDFDFDKIAMELQNEMKAQATDRMKTVEEVAKEEHERLQAAEKSRLKRMQGELDSDDEDGEGRGGKKRKVRFGNVYERSGDSLDDDFVAEGVDGKLNRGDHLVARKNRGENLDDDFGELGLPAGRGEDDEDDDDEDEDEDDEDEDDEGSEGSEGEEEEGDEDEDEDEDEEEDEQVFEEIGQDLEEEESKTIEGTPKRKVAKTDSGQASKRSALSDEEKVKRQKAAAEELPYTYTMPEDASGLASLLAGHNLKNQSIILDRLVKCYALALNPQNRSKLESLYAMLLERAAALEPEEGMKTDHDSLDAVAIALFSLAQQLPECAASETRGLLDEMQQAISDGLSDPSGPEWPSGGQLLQLKLVPAIFPTTDFVHPVATPFILLLSQMLAQCPVKSVSDAAKAVWVSSLLCECLRPAGRVSPEAVTLIASILAAAVPLDKQKTLPEMHPSRAMFTYWSLYEDPELKSGSLKTLLVCKDKDDDKSGKKKGAECEGLKLDCVLSGSVKGVSGKKEALCSTLKVATSLARAARKTATVSEGRAAAGVATMLWPISNVCDLLESVLPKSGSLRRELQKLQQELAEAAVRAKDAEPLKLYAVAPVPILQYNPKFEDGFNPDRDMDFDRERAEKRKLKRQYKKELKGATRELRKDNLFLAEEKAAQEKKQRIARDEKAKSIEAFLSQQQFEAKLGSGRKTGKSKGRKRK